MPFKETTVPAVEYRCDDCGCCYQWIPGDEEIRLEDVKKEEETLRRFGWAIIFDLPREQMWGYGLSVQDHSRVYCPTCNPFKNNEE